MNLLRLLPFLIFLSGCASPSLEFRDAASKSVVISGDEITVFFTETRAQAVRTNYRNRKQQVDAILRLMQAIEMTTGCKVNKRSLQGDIVLATATLKC